MKIFRSLLVGMFLLVISLLIVVKGVAAEPISADEWLSRYPLIQIQLQQPTDDEALTSALMGAGAGFAPRGVVLLVRDDQEPPTFVLIIHAA